MILLKSFLEMEQTLEFGLKHVYMVLLYIMLSDIMLEKKVNSNINALSKLIIIQL